VSLNHQPLWPFLIKAFSYLTLGNHLIAGLILSNVFSLIGFCLFYQLAREDCGERVANVALALMLAFPGAIFFSFVYTESLFFFLSIFFFLFPQKIQLFECLGYCFLHATHPYNWRLLCFSIRMANLFKPGKSKEMVLLRKSSLGIANLLFYYVFFYW